MTIIIFKCKNRKNIDMLRLTTKKNELTASYTIYFH